MSAPSSVRRTRRPLPLATQILLLQVFIVIATVSVGAAVSLHLSRERLDDQYGARVLAIAESVASMPTVRDAFDDPDPSATIQPIAEGVRTASGATFVVVANTEGIRYAHPNPENIGRPLSTDPGSALRGEPYVAYETGTLGRSVRAKTPVRDVEGTVVGVVSVGILEAQVQADLVEAVPELASYLSLALLLGVVGSVLLGRRVKRQTFGLEPEEIARLLEDREAILHGIREGVVVLGADRRVTLVNDEAQRLLGLDESAVGLRAEQVLPEGSLRDLAAREDDAVDQVVVAGDRVLVANRMAASVRGEQVGAVMTLRDRTELESLLRELASVRSMADALRAQAHEFSNRLHTVAGLVELGRHDDAVAFITNTTLAHQGISERLMQHVGEPAVLALLLAKTAVAQERGIDLVVDERTNLAPGCPDPREAQDLVTIIGNLIDNAFEAVGASGGRVEVSIRCRAGGTRIVVRDDGPGVDPAAAEAVFQEGFSTKTAPGNGQRGLGLALVRATVTRRGGWVSVTSEHGAVFTVELPTRRAAAPTVGELLVAP